MHELSSMQIPRLEFPKVIAGQIVMAFFVPGVAVVSAGITAYGNIGRKLCQRSQVVSLW